MRTQILRVGNLLIAVLCAATVLSLAAGARQEDPAKQNAAPKPPFTDKSERALAVKDRQLLDYAWQSPNTLLTIQGTSQAPHALLVNMATKRETPLPGLDKNLAASQPADVEKIGWQLSPDKNWLLWVENRPGEAIYHAAPLDASRGRMVTWSKGANSGPILLTRQPSWGWRQDSRGWVEVTRLVYTPSDTVKWDSVRPGDGSLHARCYLLDTPDRVQDVVPVGSKPADGQIPHTEFVGFNMQGRLVVTEWTTDGDDEAFRLKDYDVMNRLAPARQFAPKLPPDAVLREVMLSPSGRQLAWLLSRPTAARMEIWISDWMGMDFQQVSSREVALGKPEEMGKLRWTPDEKRVSYLYQGALYTVSAPAPPPLPNPNEIHFGSTIPRKLPAGQDRPVALYYP